ncbi:hypothetical protein (Partial), partial [Seminavis robusta]|eukprot:Sro4503_g354150.1 n/a (70) ;mRNA; r:2-212
MSASRSSDCEKTGGNAKDVDANAVDSEATGNMAGSLESLQTPVEGTLTSASVVEKQTPCNNDHIKEEGKA